MNRREFLHLVGGGIVVFVGLDSAAVVADEPNRFYPKDYNAYLVIGRNGRVTVFSGKIEMGQGVLTSQAQLIAEELGVSLASIDMVLGDTDRCPMDLGTFGSLTTRMFGPVLRAAAAQARAELMVLAAKKLRVAPDRLQVEHGMVSVAGQPYRRVSYGELAKGASIVRTRFLGGDILDRNFGTYQIPRFSQVPRIDGVFVKNDGLAPQGGGEPPITTMGAVIANAVFDATGARLLRLPMTPDRVRLAIAKLSAH